MRRNSRQSAKSAFSYMGPSGLDVNLNRQLNITVADHAGAQRGGGRDTNSAMAARGGPAPPPPQRHRCARSGASSALGVCGLAPHKARGSATHGPGRSCFPKASSARMHGPDRSRSKALVHSGQDDAECACATTGRPAALAVGRRRLYQCSRRPGMITRRPFVSLT